MNLWQKLMSRRDVPFPMNKPWKGLFTITVHRKGWVWDSYDFNNPFKAKAFLADVQQENGVHHATLYFQFPWQRSSWKVKRVIGEYPEANRLAIRKPRPEFRED